ncbi:MAG: hypothetical protein WCO22_11555 [Betaproteobacteria bacterium]|jgi:hypothetical protein
MARVQKHSSLSLYAHFEAPTLEEALELAKVDEKENWKFTEELSVDYFLADTDA